MLPKPASKAASQVRTPSTAHYYSNDVGPSNSETPLIVKTPLPSSSLENAAIVTPIESASELRQRSDVKVKKYLSQSEDLVTEIDKPPPTEIKPQQQPAKRITNALSLFGHSITTGARTQANYRRRLNPSLVRSVRTRHFMHYVTHIVAFFTIIFFTFSWLLHFHIIPSIEARLTQEAKFRVNQTLNRRQFELCNHEKWLNTKIEDLDYDLTRCSKHIGYDNVIIMHFEATKNCIPRTEIHPCASPDVMNNELIAWDIVYNNFKQFDCPGTNITVPMRFNDWHRTFLFFTDEMLEQYRNRLIPGILFTFQCPRCVISSGVIRTWKNFCFHSVFQISPSVPMSSVICLPIFRTVCSFADSPLISDSLDLSTSGNVYPIHIPSNLEYL